MTLAVPNKELKMVLTPGVKLTWPSQFVVWNGYVPNGGTSEDEQDKYRLGLILTDGQQCNIRGSELSITSRIIFQLKNNSCSNNFMDSLKNTKLDHIRFYGGKDGVYIQSIKNYAGLGVVNVNTMNQNVLINFPLNRWVDDKNDDRQLSKDIYPQEDPRITKYEIIVVTSIENKAGTSARIRLSLIDKNDVNSVYGYQMDDKQDNFEKGSTDKFSLYTKTIPNLSRLCISNDGSGKGPGWLPKLMIVKDTRKNKTYHFDINKWLMGGKEFCENF